MVDGGVTVEVDDGGTVKVVEQRSADAGENTSAAVIAAAVGEKTYLEKESPNAGLEIESSAASEQAERERLEKERLENERLEKERLGNERLEKHGVDDLEESIVRFLGCFLLC